MRGIVNEEVRLPRRASQSKVRLPRGSLHAKVGLPRGVSPTKKSGYHEGRCQQRGPVAMKGIANEEVRLPRGGSPMKKAGCQEGGHQRRRRVAMSDVKVWNAIWARVVMLRFHIYSPCVFWFCSIELTTCTFSDT